MPSPRVVNHTNEVSLDEIRDFRTSMSARRFPALRDLRDEDVASLVNPYIPNPKPCAVDPRPYTLNTKLQPQNPIP